MSGSADCCRESSRLWRPIRQLPALGLLPRPQPCSAVPQATEAPICKQYFEERLHAVVQAVSA